MFRYEIPLPDGTTLARRSSRHYTHALVRRNVGTKRYFVNLATSLPLAEKEARVHTEVRDYIDIVTVTPDGTRGQDHEQ